MMTNRPWYLRYAELRPLVDQRRSEFFDRCRVLGTSLDGVLREASSELIARAVHESNWQEEEYLDIRSTQELGDAAAWALPPIVGPHLALDQVLLSHHENVRRMKRRARRREEIAAYNLALAHHLLGRIGTELATRQAASLALPLKELLDAANARRTGPGEDARWKAVLAQAAAALTPVLESSAPVYGALTEDIATEGQLTCRLLELPHDALLHPLAHAHLHALHSVVLAGIVRRDQLGRYRTVAVHVGGDGPQFPQPSVLPGLMEEYRRGFPSLMGNVGGFDRILAAARASHRFVAIHPYRDGNGRVSRLLMNLVLWSVGHPPVFLKADKQGRHRYHEALRRADRGNDEPLAALIASSLIEIYESLIESASNPWAGD